VEVEIESIADWSFDRQYVYLAPGDELNRPTEEERDSPD
jgi:hypothetical protein